MAEKFNISQPSITRSMKKIEEDFGVALFERGKNHFSLNETGKLAVECAVKVLQEAENAISKVQNFDKRQKTIVIEACAPAPLWSFLPEFGKNIRISTLLCFTTNLADWPEKLMENRKEIPIIDNKANVRYHVIKKR